MALRQSAHTVLARRAHYYVMPSVTMHATSRERNTSRRAPQRNSLPALPCTCTSCCVDVNYHSDQPRTRTTHHWQVGDVGDLLRRLGVYFLDGQSGHGVRKRERDFVGDVLVLVVLWPPFGKLGTAAIVIPHNKTVRANLWVSASVVGRRQTLLYRPSFFVFVFAATTKQTNQASKQASKHERRNSK